VRRRFWFEELAFGAVSSASEEIYRGAYARGSIRDHVAVDDSSHSLEQSLQLSVRCADGQPVDMSLRCRIRPPSFWGEWRMGRFFAMGCSPHCARMTCHIGFWIMGTGVVTQYRGVFTPTSLKANPVHVRRRMPVNNPQMMAALLPDSPPPVWFAGTR
jgi:hypothetical protein